MKKTPPKWKIKSVHWINKLFKTWNYNNHFSTSQDMTLKFCLPNAMSHRAQSTPYIREKQTFFNTIIRTSPNKGKVYYLINKLLKSWNWQNFLTTFEDRILKSDRKTCNYNTLDFEYIQRHLLVIEKLHFYKTII